jgi:mannose-6-phosphate isomerase-like protein (cupin superfamily)
LSQVENFRTLPSLPLLYRLAEALDVDVAALLAATKGRRRYVLTRRGDGPVIEREEPAAGFVYRALARGKNAKTMEPFLLEIPARSTRADVTTHGDEFIYLLRGRLTFRLGRESIDLRQGDSLYFEGVIPHHPENRTGKPAQLLVLYAISG